MVSQAVAESGSRSLGTKPIGILLEAVKHPPSWDGLILRCVMIAKVPPWKWEDAFLACRAVAMFLSSRPAKT